MRQECFRMAGLLPLMAAMTFGQALPPAWYEALPEIPAGVLVGRGMAARDGDPGGMIARAKREAMRDLALSLVCRLTAQIEDVQSDAPGRENGFTSRTSVESALDLVNVRILREAVTPTAAFILAGVDRGEMREAYRGRVSRTLAAVSSAYARASEIEKDDPRAAMAAYEETLAGLRDAESALQVYLALNHQRDDISRDHIPDDHSVRRHLERLAAKTPRSLAQIADALASDLAPDGDGSGLPASGLWFVLPVEFGTTGFVSEFGHALTAALTASLAGRPGVRMTGDPARAEIRVRGQMMREGEGMLLVLRAGDRVARHFVEPRSCEAFGRERLAPPDLDRLLRDKAALYKALSEPVGLRVELRTDRIEDGPVVYRFGDQPRLAVRVNRPCHLRLIYVTADGERLLLLDRHPLGEHQANQWIPLPLDMQVCPPAGVEQLLVQAVTDENDTRLPPFGVENRDMGGGYYMPVIIEPLDQAIGQTRGMMVKKPAFFAEAVSHWSVFE